MNLASTSAKKITALTALPFAAALTLSACSGDEETETSFTNNQNGVEMTLTYTAVGDEVIKQTTTNVIEYGDTTATEEVSIDYEVADMSELSEVPGYESTGNMDEEGAFISLVESREQLGSADFTEVE